MNRIKELREDKDLRQVDVSIATGIDQRTLSNYETGKTNPDSFSIIKLANFFGVSTDYLLGNNTDCQSELNNIITQINTLKTELDKLSEDIKRYCRK